MTKDDCDCWTDEDGYWRLGRRCLEHEKDVWRRAIERVPDIIKELRRRG